MSEFLTKNEEKIEKIVKFHRSFDEMSQTQRQAWLEEMGDINIEHFFKANQRVFDEDGPRERSIPRRDFFLDVIKNRVKSDPLLQPKGHPVTNYLQENIHIRKLCEKITDTFCVEEIASYDAALNLLYELSKIHTHYLRKEDQLFPYLEKHNFTYPSTGMWKFQDEIRANLKMVIKAFEKNELNKEMQTLMRDVVKDIFDMTTREEKMLLPTSVKLLSNEEWIKMRKEEQEIGYVFIQSPPMWPEDESHKPDMASSLGSIFLQEGSLSQEQLNLFFSHLPFDVTFVDENDRVAFFNKGSERTFLRSAGVIGREVKFCHPPKSVDAVLKILEAFKAGTKESAEFWITFGGRLIHIRYFALRDSEKNYKGVVEITQDITDIKNIEGERRLLDWE
ncbi:putative PAS/PAC sensor protein [Sulfurimonas denitrificans DSM 1251]|uniref:Putative PAS/PAC sensor protein n=1 Tax=Sulfurimonas denitrificans (strain ATCC 33889 / DSM 1251) TaxID=326298 RepID=Q30QA9_SULDN|nr:PAS domain-containing protein [Sulfurimonas denitrificans]ABB44822.1 putative PAS/PAC sensor protein [Sulfurimonas denitrificans DSM 1251]